MRRSSNVADDSPSRVYAEQMQGLCAACHLGSQDDRRHAGHGSGRGRRRVQRRRSRDAVTRERREDLDPNLLADMPVVVLTRGLDASPDKQAAHAAIAKLSRNSRHAAVPGSYHEIHLSHPEAVITAILDVVKALRERRPLR